ncbi:MAG TPA: polysaccharide biosynthesis tyrosine autokinase [Terriglobales bacterium]|nr:polysaccharide biosynthesis tyrosine autokinase [Terriglobales bacterium]
MANVVNYTPPNLELAKTTSQRGSYRPVLGASSYDLTLRDAWSVLMKRRWTIIAFLTVVVTVVSVVTFRTTPQYEAVGRLVVNKEQNSGLGFKDEPVSDFEDYSVAIETQVQVLKSNALALETARALAGGAKARQTAFIETASHTNEPATPAETALYNAVRNGLKVLIVPRTRMIEIRVLNPDPQMSARIVDTLMETYIEQNFRSKLESLTSTSQWLTRQLADLQLKVESSQEKLVQYQKEHGIIGLDEKQNIITQRLDDLNRQLTAAEADRIQRETNWRFSAAGGESATKQQNEPLLDSLRLKRAELKDQYAKMLVQFGASYPKVQEVSSELTEVDSAISVEQKKAAEKLENEYRAALQREKLLRASFEEQKSEANQLNEASIQYSLLRRDVESNRQLHEGLLQKLKEAGVVAGLRSSNISKTERPQVPTSPAKPNIPMNIMLSLVFGLVGGVGLAFLVDTMDDTVRTPEQVQHVTELPALGIVPMSTESRPRLASQNGRLAISTETRALSIVTILKPTSQIAEAYRTLRTSILLASDTEPRILLITSPLPQEGKTTTAVNCAVVLAQNGARVLLVDADLRRPSAHKHFGIKQTNLGLSSLLSGQSTPEEVYTSIPDLPNLTFIPAGRQAPHPAELLSSAQMSQYLEKWRTEFDHVIVDTAPILSVTDPVLLSVQADAVMMVVRAGVTRVSALKHAWQMLSQVNANVMGVVVNGLNFNDESSYYYYGSRYSGYYHESS